MYSHRKLQPKSKKKRFCLLSVDVETHSIWHNCLRDDMGEKVLSEGMPIILELFEKYNVHSTFFFTGYIAKKFPDVVKMILPYGHEVGCHGLSYEPADAFDLLTLDQQFAHLKEAKEILEEISGREVISFRAPALRVNRFTPLALAKNGFKIDSSVSSQRFDGFFSFGALRKMKWLTSPRLPYLSRENDLYRSGSGTIVEVPISAFIIPYIGTTLRIIPSVTRLVRFFLHLESGINKKPVVFDIHPNEFIDEADGPRKIKRRSRNFFAFIVGDLLRGKLKVKNLGKAAAPLFENEIKFFKNKNYKLLPIKDYCREMGFDV